MGIVPHTQQTTDFTCGPSCLNSALLYWGIRSPGEHILGTQLGTTYLTPPGPEHIANVARSYGLYAQTRVGLSFLDLVRYVRQGETVIVTWFYEDTGHYTLVTGMDENYIYMMDPWRQEPTFAFPISYFLRNWYRGTTFNGIGIRISGYPSTFY
jgi:predicted double-glycine peptidase